MLYVIVRDFKFRIKFGVSYYRDELGGFSIQMIIKLV